MRYRQGDDKCELSSRNLRALTMFSEEKPPVATTADRTIVREAARTGLDRLPGVARQPSDRPGSKDRQGMATLTHRPQIRTHRTTLITAW